MMYKTPKEYYFRLHHVRPRFKNNVEEVLIYMATEVSKIPKLNKSDFILKFDNTIRLFSENVRKTEKTIKNWRTEISSLFGFIEVDSENNTYKPGKIAQLLADNQDLVEFFKYFLFTFQYPGGHLKPLETKKYIEAGINFKPAKFILKLLEIGENNGKRFYINKAELTHCIFNDTRFTTGKLSEKDALNLIINNRKNNVKYDWSGDVVRYAGDILDYMVLANLLEVKGNNFIINWAEREAIIKFITDETRFDKYDNIYNKAEIELKEVSCLQEDWFFYVNSNLDKELFKTDVLEYLGVEKSGYELLINETISSLHDEIHSGEAKTKNIGDLGENLIIGHESMRVKIGGREDLIKLIKKIPTQFAVGYDIQSVELDERKRYVEVKSTISNKKINFQNIHLTPNEWNVAETLGERYFIYRLAISKENIELFLIQDPVEKYRTKLIKMSPRNGADIVFSEKSGTKEELLIWSK
jgi:hypothetical protein